METTKWLLHELYSWLPDGSWEQCPAVQEFAVYGLAALLSLNMVIILLLVASTRRQIARVEAENELRLEMLTLDMIDTVTASRESAAHLPSSSQFLGLSDSGDPLPVALHVADSMGYVDYVVNSVKSNSDCTPSGANEADHAIDVIDNASRLATHANRVSSHANHMANHANSTGSISQYPTPSSGMEPSMSSESGKVLVKVLVKLKRLVRSSANTSRQRRMSERIRLRQSRQSRLAMELADQAADVVDHASISASVSSHADRVSSHADRATSHAKSMGSISKLYSTPSAMTLTPSALLKKSMSSESGKVLLKRLVRSSSRPQQQHLPRSTSSQQHVPVSTSRQQHLPRSPSRRMSDRIRLRGTKDSSG